MPATRRARHRRRLRRCDSVRRARGHWSDRRCDTRLPPPRAVPAPAGPSAAAPQRGSARSAAAPRKARSGASRTDTARRRSAVPRAVHTRRAPRAPRAGSALRDRAAASRAQPRPRRGPSAHAARSPPWIRPPHRAVHAHTCERSRAGGSGAPGKTPPRGSQATSRQAARGRPRSPAGRARPRRTRARLRRARSRRRIRRDAAAASARLEQAGRDSIASWRSASAGASATCGCCGAECGTDHRAAPRSPLVRARQCAPLPARARAADHRVGSRSGRCRPSSRRRARSPVPPHRHARRTAAPLRIRAVRRAPVPDRDPGCRATERGI